MAEVFVPFISERMFNEDFYCVLNQNFGVRKDTKYGTIIELLEKWALSIKNKDSKVFALEGQEVSDRQGKVTSGRYGIRSQPLNDSGEYFDIFVSYMSGGFHGNDNLTIKCHVFSVKNTESGKDLKHKLVALAAELRITFGEKDETTKYIHQLSNEQLKMLTGMSINGEKIRQYLQSEMSDLYKEQRRLQIVANL